MGKLLEIEKKLKARGYKWDIWSLNSLIYNIEHHSIISFEISSNTFRDDNISMWFHIRVKTSSIEEYRKRGYEMYCELLMIDIDSVWGSKSFQLFEDLLDELQDLGLINCGHNIKSGY